MGIIQKRADELKPGDIVVIDDARYALQYVSLAAPGDNMSEEHRLYCLAGIGRRIEAQPGLDRIGRWMPPDMPVHVEVAAPDLTPAQQHAEGLVGMLYRALASDSIHATPGAWVADAETLLAEIKPPEPPTLAEALAALFDVVELKQTESEEMGSFKRASGLLDRARRAKVLP